MNTGTNQLPYHRFFTALFSILLIVFPFQVVDESLRFFRVPPNRRLLKKRTAVKVTILKILPFTVI